MACPPRGTNPADQHRRSNQREYETVEASQAQLCRRRLVASPDDTTEPTVAEFEDPLRAQSPLGVGKYRIHPMPDQDEAQAKSADTQPEGDQGQRRQRRPIVSGGGHELIPPLLPDSNVCS
jgi:hypothetical protein